MDCFVKTYPLASDLSGALCYYDSLLDLVCAEKCWSSLADETCWAMTEEKTARRKLFVKSQLSETLQILQAVFKYETIFRIFCLILLRFRDVTPFRSFPLQSDHY